MKATPPLCELEQEARRLGRCGYTPVADVATGQVIVLGGRVRIASHAIPAGQLGTLSTRGVFSGLAGSGTIDAGEAVYWDEGAAVFTTDPSGNTFAGYATEGKAAGDARVMFALADAAPTTGATGGDLTAVIPDPGDGGTISVASSGSCLLGAASDYGALALPPPSFVGQLLSLNTNYNHGGCTVHTPCVRDGGSFANTILVGGSGAAIALYGANKTDLMYWVVLANNGCTFDIT